MTDRENPDIEAIKLAIESGTADRDFWHSRTPEERMIAIELMRQRVYGYDEKFIPRIERVIEFLPLKRNQNPEDCPEKNCD